VSGLTAADRARIARDRAELNSRLPKGARPLGPPVLSPERRAALIAMPIKEVPFAMDVQAGIPALQLLVDRADTSPDSV
jgi:hypothetical protein